MLKVFAHPYVEEAAPLVAVDEAFDGNVRLSSHETIMH